MRESVAQQTSFGWVVLSNVGELLSHATTALHQCFVEPFSTLDDSGNRSYSGLFPRSLLRNKSASVYSRTHTLEHAREGTSSAYLSRPLWDLSTTRTAVVRPPPHGTTIRARQMPEINVYSIHARIRIFGTYDASRGGWQWTNMLFTSSWGLAWVTKGGDHQIASV